MACWSCAAHTAAGSWRRQGSPCLTTDGSQCGEAGYGIAWQAWQGRSWTRAGYLLKLLQTRPLAPGRRRHGRHSATSALPTLAADQLASAGDFSIGMLGGNFLTLGTTLLLPALCVPARQRDEAARGLSTAAFNLMFPCLLLVQTAAVVGSGPDLTALAGLAAVATVQIAIGAACGAACARAAGLQDSSGDPVESARFRQAVIASAFGNATTLPLVLGTSLCATIPQLAADAGAADRFVGYLALYQLAWSTALWTLGYSYLAPSPATGQGDHPGVSWSEASQVPEQIAAAASRLASPPSLGSLGGAVLGYLGLGATPPVASPAFPVYSALNLLGQGAQPALATVLSLTLLGTLDDSAEANGPTGDSTASDPASQRSSQTIGGAPSWMQAVDLPQLSATVATRGVLVPLLGGSVAEWAWKQHNILPDDPVAHLVLLIEATMPSAQVLVLLAQVRRREQDDGGVQATSIARLLLFQYATMLVPISAWLPICLACVYSF
mmetsp:Transcript_28760/g.80983  ORF Transcript_28760/g.80983 Transcript_28760/m.80983 type:complete len:496 (-) Transcript_28760:116-1603(-)